jgi:hypothetical protein
VAVAQYDPMAPADSERAQKAAAEWDIDANGIDRMCARFTAATDGRYKLVLRNDRELFYDLQADPGEQAPIDLAKNGAAPDGAAGTLRAALEHPAVTQTAAAVEPTHDLPVATDEELAEIERKMQLLGYM